MGILRFGRKKGRNGSSDGEGPGDAGFFPPSATALVPPVEIYEREGEWVVEAELPGVEPERIRVTVEEDTLTIEGEKRRRRASAEADLLRSERHFGPFSCSVALPDDASLDGITARYRHGVLSVVVPKRAVPRARRIRIR